MHTPAPDEPKPATAADWKRLPAPAAQLRADLGFQAQWAPALWPQLTGGLLPRAMEDKWFIYFDAGWLHFHRSWTGAQIYALRLTQTPNAIVVTESWVSRDPQHHKGTDTAYDRRLLAFLIDALLLGKPDAKFPLPAGHAGPPGAAQHMASDMTWPET